MSIPTKLELFCELFIEKAREAFENGDLHILFTDELNHEFIDLLRSKGYKVEVDDFVYSSSRDKIFTVSSYEWKEYNGRFKTLVHLN
jgi:hypothetical protein